MSVPPPSGCSCLPCTDINRGTWLETVASCVLVAGRLTVPHILPLQAVPQVPGRPHAAAAPHRYARTIGFKMFCWLMW